MNLRGMKKVHEDEKTAVFKNQRGHEVKVAKSGLSKSHLYELEKLPLYKAEGGSISEEESKSQPMEQATASQPQAQMPERQSISQSEGVPQPQIPQMAAQNDLTPLPTPEQVAAQHAQEQNKEAAAHWSDLMQGHIKPQTYQSLYAKKDTTGKIGTLFGLLVSGAGSGLTHQPNAVLEMMNKEIDRDLEAQKQSSEKVQNYYHLNQMNELNKANIKQKGVETLGTLKDIEAKSLANAKTGMQLSATHKLLNDLNMLPPGPQKQQALQKFGEVQNAVNQDIQVRNAKLGQQLVSDPEGEYQQRQGQLRTAGSLGVLEGADKIAAANDERHVPGVGEASIPVPDGVRKEFVAHQKLEDAAKDLFNFTKKHTTLIPGSPEYNIGEEKAEVLRQMVREGMLGTVFRESEKPLLEKFVPKNPGGFLKVLQAQPKLRTLIDSNIRAGNALKEQYGIPVKSSPASGQEEKVLKSKSGRPYVIRDGKPVYK